MAEFLSSLNLRLDQILPAEKGGTDDLQFSNTQSARVTLATIEIDPNNLEVKIINKDDDEASEFKYDDLMDTTVSALILPNEL